MINDGLLSISSNTMLDKRSEPSHVVGISADGERETAMDFRVRGLQIRILQGATSQHGLLRAVERDGTKLLPVTDELVFDDNLMNCKFTLSEVVSLPNRFHLSCSTDLHLATSR